MVDAEAAPTARSTGRFAGARAWAVAHPVLVVAVTAAVLRIVAAVVSFSVHHRTFIPDEGEYLALARLVARGRPADDLIKGYGQAFYDATWPFTGVLAFLFRTISESRLVGQLYAATFGVATASLVAALGRHLVSRRLALAAGLVVAAMPSQVMWSSVVLRESLIWAALAGLAVLLARSATSTGWRLAGFVAVAAVVLFALIHLRSQTAVVAAWALLLAAWIIPGRSWLVRGSAFTAVCLVVPLAAGLGIGGIELVTSAAPTLARTRTYMGFDADSAVADAADRPTSAVSTDCAAQPVPEHGAGDVGAEAVAGAKTEKLSGGRYVVCDRSGRAIVVEDGLSTNLRYLPRGIVATMLRPFPWESARNTEVRVAAVENLLWYVLYVLAAVGIALAGWRRLRELAFPFLVGGFLIATSALTQGNLGTAFRHRAQILWALAVFAAVGVSALEERRARRRPAPGARPEDEARAQPATVL